MFKVCRANRAIFGNMGQDKQELICKLDSLAFPLREGIPVLLETEARALAVEESQS